MKTSTFIITFLAAVTLLCGCERKPHTPPPVERVALVVRFFNSMENKDYASAVRQGYNIFNLDRTQNNVQTLIYLQESNEADKVHKALPVIEKALKLYPQNNTLESTRAKLRQLRNAQSLIASMKKARTSSAMSSARSAAETGLSQNVTPQLQAFFDNYKQLEAKQADFERKHTADSLEAATAAAEKAKAEDAAREAENLRFMQEMAAKTAIGEKMRKDAGSIPFEPDAGVNTDRK